MIIAQVAFASSPSPSRAMLEITRIVEQSAIDITGDAETVPSAETATRRYRRRPSWRSIHLLAIDGDIGQRITSDSGLPLLAGSADGVALWGESPLQPISITPEQPWSGEAVGTVDLAIPLRENLDSAYVDINTLRDRDDAYGPLWDAAESILRAEGRTKVSAYADHPFGTELSAPSSPVSLEQTRFSRFLTSQGFELTQTEICSRLALPPDEAVLAELTSQALAKSADYRTLSWAGPTSEEHRADMVAMATAFALDMPTAGIVEAEADYDIDRLVEAEKSTAELGITSLITAAQHIDSGRLVGYTRLDLEKDKRAVIQEDTLVLKDHRGHRLGLLLKAENLRQLLARSPERTFIQTWNAGENEWMWAINERLGFTPHVGTGLWQKEIRG